MPCARYTISKSGFPASPAALVADPRSLVQWLLIYLALASCLAAFETDFSRPGSTQTRPASSSRPVLQLLLSTGAGRSVVPRGTTNLPYLYLPTSPLSLGGGQAGLGHQQQNDWSNNSKLARKELKRQGLTPARPRTARCRGLPGSRSGLQ